MLFFLSLRSICKGRFALFSVCVRKNKKYIFTQKKRVSMEKNRKAQAGVKLLILER